MRKEVFEQKDFFYVTNRGAGGSNIFIDDQDKSRFLFLITHLQSPISIYNTYWYADKFPETGTFKTKENRINTITKKRHVSLLVFTILNDSFHLIVQNLSHSILSVYMQRVLTAYSKYFNAKYKKRGHVFNGPFEAKFIKDESELSKFSALIHRKPGVQNQIDYEKYPFSSYQDYIGPNRWSDLLLTEIIIKQFKDQAKYRDFVSEISEEKFI